MHIDVDLSLGKEARVIETVRQIMESLSAAV
jgi:hypothetical protein